MGTQTVFHFTVDGEQLTTTEPLLTVAQILTLAGLDLNQHYLVEYAEHRINYKGRNAHVVTMHDGQVFVSAHLGPVPVS